MTPPHFFGDDPVTGTPESPDRLDRVGYAAHIVNLLERVRAQSDSSVMALIAPWGAGKSSALALTVRALRQRPSDAWLVTEFNPWTYSDMESLLLGFFGSLRAAIPKDKRWNETRKTIGEVGRAVSPLGGLTALAGVDGTSIARAAAKLIEGDTSAAATHKKADTALRKLGRPILMVLDDLDRLAPAELLLVMKLVRLVGRLPNVYYLLAYDERTLKDVLRRTELVGNDEQRAADYLEKIVQVRLDLPPLRSQQTAGLVNAALDDILERNQLTLSPDQTHLLQQAYNELLQPQLETPRAINRFFGQLDAFYGLVQAEVDFVDFTLMTWFRTTAPELYSLLRVRKADLTGSNLRRMLGNRSTHAQQLAEWQDLLRDVGVRDADLDATLLVLGLLFTPIRSARENTAFGDYYTAALAKRKGVGHVDYFDRYFTFGIPEEDIADGLVVDALRQLGGGNPGPELNKLRARIVDDNARVVRKLMALAESETLPAEPLLTLLADTYGDLPESSGVFGTDPRWSVEHLARLLLPQLDEAQGPAVLERMSRTDSGRFMASRLVDRISQQSTGEDSPQTPGLTWLTQARATMLRLLRERLDQVTTAPAEEAPNDVISLIWAWRHLGDNQEVATWLDAQAGTPGWSPLEVLASLVPVGSVSGGGPSRPALGELEADTVDSLYGLDRLISELSDQIDEAQRPSSSWADEPTSENRRNHVLRVLKAVRERRIAQAGTQLNETDAARRPSPTPAEKKPSKRAPSVKMSGNARTRQVRTPPSSNASPDGSLPATPRTSKRASKSTPQRKPRAGS